MSTPSQHDNNANDMTNKKATDDLLSLRFEQFYIAVEQSPVATAITNADGCIEFVNQ
ncbi:hypothetical protein [Halomonas llamarensis]|uniref:PAS domain-containing protein n=1 Tax=Halomonas llamarensis TaxID=2945104 RepID=A0ABT0SP91_9GAMM|nr:hypothetical protein [Halomonas llamarensis]MCL7929648.1 hypothetical protein [Halomonas llamarensis]